MIAKRLQGYIRKESMLTYRRRGGRGGFLRRSKADQCNPNAGPMAESVTSVAGQSLLVSVGDSTDSSVSATSYSPRGFYGSTTMAITPIIFWSNYTSWRLVRTYWWQITERTPVKKLLREKYYLRQFFNSPAIINSF